LTNEISDKTQVLLTRSVGRFYLTPDQAERVKAALKNPSINHVEFEGNLIMTHEIQGIIDGAQIKIADDIKRGEWKCAKHNNWIPKGKICGYCG
jgi:hypothetical protein